MDVVIPDMGAHTADVVVMKWRVAPGDRVACGDALADVESWKAAVTVEAEQDGVVRELCIKAGKATAVGSVICRIDPE